MLAVVMVVGVGVVADEGVGHIHDGGGVVNCVGVEQRRSGRGQGGGGSGGSVLRRGILRQ